jgi:hypothetical protein
MLLIGILQGVKFILLSVPINPIFGKGIIIEGLMLGEVAKWEGY